MTHHYPLPLPLSQLAKSSGVNTTQTVVRTFFISVLAFGLMTAPVRAEVKATTVVQASGKTNAYISANGVPVVNIETANSKGLSHNKLATYNVETNGLVINNGNNSQVSRQSTLAGQVISNLNLVDEAKVILMEVVSTNRSTLAGFQEVLGGKADVIVANPNGITCNGCGFLNTDRVTMTTGVSNTAGDGSLSGFSVNRGDILVQGLGANGSTQQVFDLVARSIRLEGNINVAAASSLGLAVGNNIWSYTSRNVTGSTAGSGATPAYAFDSTALGGMYAGRIRIVATEAGVGVRMLGEAAASADDFTLTSAGKVEIRSAVSAARDAAIAATSATSSEDLFFNGAGAKVSASRNADLTVTGGQIKLAEAELYATNNLTVSGGTLSDISTSAKTRYAGANSTTTLTGAALINGGVWGAGAALTGSYDSLTIDAANSAKIYAGTTLDLTTASNMALATAAVRSAGNMSLASTTGEISTASGATQGVQVAAGNLSMTAGNGLTNAGTITADAGSIAARVDGAIINAATGTIHSKTNMDIADKNGGTVVNIVNSGTVLAAANLTVKATNITNQSTGTIQGTTATAITATTLTNAGTFIASSTAGQSGALTLANLSNSGTLQSAQNLTIGATSTLANTGTVLASNDLSINAGTSALVISNTALGVMQATNGLAITGANATFDAQSGKVVGNTVAATLSSLNNSGTVQSETTTNLTVGNGITNSGTVLAKTAFASSSANLTNSGTLQANNGASVTVTNALTNTGTLIASNTAANSGTLNVGTLSNTGAGVIQSAKNLAINAAGNAVTNSNKIIANNNLAIASTGAGLTLNNNSGGYLQAGNAAGDMVAIIGMAVTLNNNLGGHLMGNQMNLSASSVTNAGLMQGGTGVSTVSASGAIANSGMMNVASSGTVTAASLDNTGTLQSSGALAVNITGAIANVGSLMGSGSLTANAGSLSNTGTLQGGSGASTLNAATVVNNTGGIMTLATSTGGSGTINAVTMTNAGILQSNGAAAINVSDAVTNSNNILIDGALTVRGTAAMLAVINTGRIQSGALLDIKGQNAGNGVNLTVGTTGVLLGDSMDVKAQTIAVNNGGMISTSGDMTINANTLTFGGTTSRIVAATSSTGNADITLSNNFSNVGAVHSGQNLTFNAPNISNSNTGGFSALDTLTVIATSGNVTNAGALYAGKQLNVQASGNITNSASTGTMDSDDSMAITAGGTLTNNHAITAKNDIAITATTFRNEITGGVPSRNWTSISWGADNRTSHQEEYGDTTDYYEKIGSSNQYFTSAVPSVKPQIIAGRNMSITGFSSGYNTGGVIAASSGTLTINGTGSFTNDDLSLQSKQHMATWNRYEDCNSIGTSCDEWITRSYEDHVTSTSTARSYGAGIFASTLNASGFALVNQSSTWTASTTTKSAAGASSTSKVATNSLNGPVAATAGSAAVGGVTTASGKAAVAFGGLVITLPTNPNGYFVSTTNPASRYLVEVNPLFTVGSNFVGSDYMQNRYGYNPDSKVKLLGDANYEAFLIKQELIAKTGRNLLTGYQSEKQQMQAFMDNALDEGKRLGFVYGRELSEDQKANLKSDIVWMVETTIGGQRVLAPVVYLAQETRNAIQIGAVVAGNNVNLDLTSFTNTGGTVSGKNALTVVSKGDITNSGGTISGGNVALKSTEGSIKNETVTSGDGTSESFSTSIGKTGGITATGNLALDAKKDITVIGANVAAGGNASLAAGGNVTFDTIVDKSTSTTRDSEGSGFSFSNTTTTTSTNRNIGSNLTVGGNLAIKSGGDTTIAGSSVTAGGDFKADTGGSLNILARQDSTTTKTVAETAGMGVGGGVFGTEKKTTDDFVGTNRGSTLNVGGNATIKSADTVTIQGSNVNVVGNGSIDAKSVNVLDGLDERRTTTVTDTTTFLSAGSASSSGASANSASNAAGTRAAAGGSAQANANNSSELNLASTTTTTENFNKTTSVASNLNFGGNLNIKAANNVVVQGSDINAGGNLAMNAQNVTVLAGRNTETRTVDTTTTSLGIYSDSQANAGANGKASAAIGSAKAEGTAQAAADSTTTIGARVTQTNTFDQTVTNRASTIRGGGNVVINAANDATFIGAQVEAGKNLDIKAVNITNLAAQDTTLSTSSRTQTTAGVYLSGEGSAQASGKADATGRKLEGNASASAEAGAGLRVATNSTDTARGTVTNQVSSFRAGGDITRTASNAIVDQGTQLDAGGNINQTAKTLTEIDARDRTFSSTSSSSLDARLGVYADAQASASGGGSGGEKRTTTAGADASVGIKASVKGSSSTESDEQTSAVTTRYRAGGNINSTTTEATTLIGTKFESGGDVNLNAKTIDFQAARDTTTRSNSSTEGSVMAKGGLAVSGGKVEAEGSFAKDGGSSSSSSARAGSINAAGNLNIRTQGDTRLEGTSLSAGQDATIASTDGSVKFESAKSTTTGESSGFNASASVKVSGEGASGSVAGGFKKSNESSLTNDVATVRTGGALNVSAGRDVNLEGTKLASAGDTNIDAKGKVNLQEVKDTSTSISVSVQGGVSVSKQSSEPNQNPKDADKSGNIDVALGYTDNAKSTGAQVSSGGALNIRAGTITNQEADLKSGGGTNLVGKVENAKKSEDKNINLNVEVAQEFKSKSQKEKATESVDKEDKAVKSAAAKKSNDEKTAKKKADTEIEAAKTPEQKKADKEAKVAADKQTKADNKAKAKADKEAEAAKSPEQKKAEKEAKTASDKKAATDKKAAEDKAKKDKEDRIDAKLTDADKAADQKKAVFDEKVRIKLEKDREQRKEQAVEKKEGEDKKKAADKAFLDAQKK